MENLIVEQFEEYRKNEETKKEIINYLINSVSSEIPFLIDKNMYRDFFEQCSIYLSENELELVINDINNNIEENFKKDFFNEMMLKFSEYMIVLFDNFLINEMIEKNNYHLNVYSKYFYQDLFEILKKYLKEEEWYCFVNEGYSKFESKVVDFCKEKYLAKHILDIDNYVESLLFK